MDTNEKIEELLQKIKDNELYKKSIEDITNLLYNYIVSDNQQKHRYLIFLKEASFIIEKITEILETELEQNEKSKDGPL